MTQKGKQDPTCGDEDTMNSAAHLISAPFYGSRKKKMDPLSLAKHLHGMQVPSAIITQEDYTTSRFDSVAVAAAAAAVAIMLRTMLPLLLLLLLLLPMLLSAMDLLLDLIHHSSRPFLVVLLLLAVLIMRMLVLLLVSLLLVVSSNVELLLDLMDNP
ncbi:hypothetical protein C4D60_Mb04t28620 [Musa balbisiana]|uniref:Uncharacterized protein n=1 Tax=Musa balbisiana TaxID=52838 RepID=A0A4S8KFW7_MUSBA|nr:hypothetical protein C4D60_Mb04t28620 [Musa balbisiana]